MHFRSGTIRASILDGNGYRPGVTGESARPGQRRTDPQVVFVSRQIPGNTGCIARTCAAAAVGLHLVEPFGSELNSAKLKRAGLDYWPYRGEKRTEERNRNSCECHDLFEDLVPYVEAWRWQKETVDRICASLAREEEVPNSVVLLQHPPVYTMGTRSSEAYLRFNKDHPPFELHRTERGGEVTYHGPGQLVMYPIMNLRRQKMDLHWYLRMLEEVVIRALWSACRLRASRVDGLTGVWVGDAKVTAIGVRVSRWITYHGLALNVNTDLAPFQNIVPCGIGDRPVGSIKHILHTMRLSCGQGSQQLETFQGDARYELPGDAAILDRLHQSLRSEFAEVFQMDLISPINKGPKSIPHPQTHLAEENLEAFGC